MDQLVALLRAAGEPTRLRLLAILSLGELTVSELTQVLGHSQPRISRHLKLMVDAGLLERKPEGSWVFYRLAQGPKGPKGANAGDRDLDGGGAGKLAQLLASLVPKDTPGLERDLERLEMVKSARAAEAGAYFRENAERWDELRVLHAPEADVEAAVLELAGPGPHRLCLDLGTGTGRMLELLAPLIERGEGIDTSHAMLTIARLNLDRPEFSHCQVRHGDIFALPFPNGRNGSLNSAESGVDLVVLHQVLHYLADPKAAVAEATRVLSPGGRLLVVDFAPHTIEALRESHAHRRLGFADTEMRALLETSGLKVDTVRHLAPLGSGDDPKLTVSIWRAFAVPADAAAQELESTT